MELVPRNNGRLRIGKVLMMMALTGLLVLTLSRPYLTLSSNLSHAYTSSFRQYSYFLCIFLTLTASLIDRPNPYRILVPVPITIFIIWCALSIFWSEFPSASLARLVLTISVIWISFTSINSLGNRRSLFLIRVLLGVLLVLNYFAVFFDPIVGITNASLPDYAHQWRGLMAHKNIAGTVAALTVVVFLFNGTTASRSWRYPVVLAAMVFLGFTQSRTSIIGLIVSVIAGGTVNLFGKAIANQLEDRKLILVSRVGYIACAVTGITLILLTINGGVLLDIASNPDFWTGRGKIWQPMLVSYLRNPVLGTGYGAFWAQSQTIEAYGSDASPLKGVTQGHNGYLDLAIQIGLPGLLLGLIGVVAWPAATLFRVVRSNVATGALAIAGLAFFLVNNAAETSLFDGDQIPQVFAMLALGMLAAAVRRGSKSPREKFSIMIKPRDSSTAVRRRRRSVAPPV